jgi:hypothetical protein
MDKRWTKDGQNVVKSGQLQNQKVKAGYRYKTTDLTSPFISTPNYLLVFINTA